MEILIGADIVPTDSNVKHFINGEIDELIDSKLQAELNSADYRIFNLEIPLTDEEAPIAKCGPNLIASAKTVTGIKNLGVNFLTLANNHILDQGTQGLTSTMQVLDNAGISYAGAGDTLHEAVRPHIADINGCKIGIYCCAEHEFSIATDTTAGANPFDPLESLDHIVNLKSQCDYMIVLYHGGKEHYRYPSPRLQGTCRKIAEKGADLVVCQHSHCIGCEEKWGKSTIVYGQGNFLFDHSNSEFWKTSILISLVFENDLVEIEYIPLTKNGNAVRLADSDQGEKILSDFYKRSEQIKENGFIEKKYADFAEECINMYLKAGVPFGNSIVLRVLNKLAHAKWFINRLSFNGKLAVYNYLNCEAHRELYLQGLKNHLFG